MLRRDLLIGSACLGAAAVVPAVKPHRRKSLLGKRKLAALVPMKMGDWTAHDVSDLVAPKTEDSLAARLYSQTVGRVYVNAVSGLEIMMLLAYGDTQSDQLQLHRPEKCYPAFGFELTRSQPTAVALAPGVAVPGRRLVAKRPDRLENIVYWSRVGEFLPVSGSEQRFDQLKMAMSGRIQDGVLVRFSSEGDQSDQLFSAVQTFAGALVRSTRPANRPVMIGSQISQRLAAAGV